MARLIENVSPGFNDFICNYIYQKKWENILFWILLSYNFVDIDGINVIHTVYILFCVKMNKHLYKMSCVELESFVLFYQ